MPDREQQANGARRPRASGLTMVLDRLYGLIREEFEQISDYVDVIEIGWGLPLVWKEDAVASRLKYFKTHGIEVSMSGTLLEYFAFQNDVNSILEKARRLGFTIVEISDGIIDLTHDEKAELVRLVKSYHLDYFIAVGKKNPAAQLSTAEAISQIDAALALNPKKVVLEGREREGEAWEFTTMQEV